MASTQQLKSRIRSVKSTKQITKAMQLVAASKMRRAQEADKASAPYTQASNGRRTYRASQGATYSQPLVLTHKPVKTRLLIVVAADKGLAGAYNSNVMKLYTRELKVDDTEGIANKTIAVGRRATQFVTRIKDTEIIGAYEDMPDHPAGAELRSILDTARDQYESGDVDAVDIIYTEFVNSLSQVAKIQRVMPAGYEITEVSDAVREAEYEPDLETVLDGVAYRLVGAQIFQAMLDAKASEWSMRMIAMKNATDNASDLADDLTLEMNKARQGAITQELAEISGGVEALND